MHSIKFLSLLTILLITNICTSQVIEGYVYNEHNIPIENIVILDTISKRKKSSNQNGKFFFPITKNCVLKITHQNYDTVFIPITLFKSDTLIKTIQLHSSFQEIEEITVSSEKYQVVIDQKNTNIIDYLPFNNSILTLKSIGNKKFLSIESQNSTILKFTLKNKKIKTITTDCYGNIHLLSKDSAYQVWIDTTLHYIESIGIDKYNRLIKSCIANTSKNTTFYNFTDHNKKYIVTSINKESKNKKRLLEISDEIAENTAQEYYQKIIRYYFDSTDARYNVILLGVWSGSLMELPTTDPELTTMITWYLKILESELKIFSFQYNQQTIVFDLLNNSMHFFSPEGVKIQTIQINQKYNLKNISVIQDKKNNLFYVLSLKSGIYSIYKINTKNGEIEFKFSLEEIQTATNLKTHNNWLYFEIIKNGYHKLMKRKIISSQEER